MLPDLPMYIIIVANCSVLLVIGYFLLQLQLKEKKIKQKEHQINGTYHNVVDDALGKEKKIIDDATSEATKIISGAQLITNTSQSEVHIAVKQLIDHIQKEGQTISSTFTSEYAMALKQLTQGSLTEFQTIMTQLQADLKKQIDEFHTTLLPNVEKELDTYKQQRMKDIDQAVVSIIQRASQEIFNKSLTVSDHNNIVIDSLEKAKKEGVFD